jgi:hypothetical protein
VGCGLQRISIFPAPHLLRAFDKIILVSKHAEIQSHVTESPVNWASFFASLYHDQNHHKRRSVCCCSRILLLLTQLQVYGRYVVSLSTLVPFSKFSEHRGLCSQGCHPIAIAKYGKINGAFLFPLSTSSSDNT